MVPEEGSAGAESSAAHLHRAGVAQVVGYYGPIHDQLSTRAEVAIYGALAAGETARHALRRAREALWRPFRATGEDHRPGRAAVAMAAAPISAEGAVGGAAEEAAAMSVVVAPEHRGEKRRLVRDTGVVASARDG